jgi:cobalt-zinc-cadmium efflux system outer membrane protein
MPKLLTHLSIVLCLFSAQAVFAAPEITDNEALEAFYRYNYDILINKYEIDKAYADAVTAKLLPNPNLSVNYVGNQIRLLPQAGDNTQLTLRLEQLIELGGKRDLRSAAATETLEAVKLGHKDTVRTLLAGFYNLLYNLKLDQLTVEEAGKDLERYDHILDVATKRHAAGHLSLIDFTKLKLARIDLENVLTTSEAQLKNDREQLAMLIGKDAPFQVATGGDESIPVPDGEKLLQTARQNRFDLLSLQKQLDASTKNNALAKAGRIPDLTVGVEYDTYGTHSTPTIGAGFSFDLPLFNRNQGEIAKRHAEHGQLQVQIDRLQRQIVLDVRQASNNCTATAKVFAAYASRKQEMDQLMQRSEQAFTLGGITVLDLLDTRKSYRDFLNKYNQALVQNNLNGKLLKVATGELK